MVVIDNSPDPEAKITESPFLTISEGIRSDDLMG